MARITAEDCNKVIPDRFRLVVLATRYAKLLNYKVETSQSKKKSVINLLLSHYVELLPEKYR